MLSRRTFIRGAAGLLVAAGAGELLLPERSLAQQFANAVDAEYRQTIWALDQRMIPDSGFRVTGDYEVAIDPGKTPYAVVYRTQETGRIEVIGSGFFSGPYDDTDVIIRELVEEWYG